MQSFRIQLASICLQLLLLGGRGRHGPGALSAEPNAAARQKKPLHATAWPAAASSRQQRQLQAPRAAFLWGRTKKRLLRAHQAPTVRHHQSYETCPVNVLSALLSWPCSPRGSFLEQQQTLKLQNALLQCAHGFFSRAAGGLALNTHMKTTAPKQSSLEQEITLFNLLYVTYILIIPNYM